MYRRFRNTKNSWRSNRQAMKNVNQKERGGVLLMMLTLLLFVISVMPCEAARISGVDEGTAPVIVEDSGDIQIEEPAIVEEPLEDAVSAREKTMPGVPEKTAKETVPPKKGADKEEKKS
ncbi:MAG TPA: hypothetical protein PLA32_10610, partial [Smithella sp.]|nr:hypothetical protein [Smithella sp.]